MSLSRSLRFCLLSGFLILWAAVGPGLAQPAPSASALQEQLTSGALSPKSLPNLLAEGAENLADQLKSLQKRLSESQQELAASQVNLKNLQLAVASITAAMAVQKPALSQVQDLLAAQAFSGKRAQDRVKSLGSEIDTLQQSLAQHIIAENTLRNQMMVLQAAGEPITSSPEVQQSLSRYLRRAANRDQLETQILDNLQQTRQVMEEESRLLAGLRPNLKQLETTWKSELLKVTPPQMSVPEQLVSLWHSLAALPGKGLNWLHVLVASGALAAFFLDHLFHLLGLLAFLTLLVWGTRHLRRQTAKRFKDWRARHTHLELLPLFVLGKILIDSLELLSLIFWMGFAFWDLGVLGTNPAQFVLYLLSAWLLLRLALALVQTFFAGRGAGGVLPLGESTARFYRRSLKVFVFYLILGIVALQSAPLLHFPDTSRRFAADFFLVGVLAGLLWLLRRHYLARLQPALPDPAWVRRPAVARFLRGALLLLLAIIILSSLLDLSNLTSYLAQGAAWTLMAACLFWFLWLAGETVIFHLLHPDLGWAQQRYPNQQEFLQRVYDFSRLLLSLILGAAVILWSLDFWGVPPSRVAWAFRWLTWGPVLGPVQLTPLNVGGALLTLYFGFWLSRLARTFMSMRIFPRTGLDQGVQYTIATSVHYIVLILTILVAISVLGFPLTNLALVAGALGVGIGFGLQNIVNNFISGLILLFERPIKVGDILVIDGQWGTVKEIRVRSTIFETSDRYVLIIPNSELISSKVLNWTRYGRGINRLTLKVGVGYNSEVRLVTQVLTEVCRANPRVVDDPPPQIYFAVYGESSLDFTIWVHLRIPEDRIPATHELNSAIFEAFQQHGIEIPFPQRDLHIRAWPEPPGK